MGKELFAEYKPIGFHIVYRTASQSELFPSSLLTSFHFICSQSGRGMGQSPTLTTQDTGDFGNRSQTEVPWLDVKKAYGCNTMLSGVVPLSNGEH